MVDVVTCHMIHLVRSACMHGSGGLRQRRWVLGIDYFGPFEPDCDGNVWGLCGVETAHTDLGFLELSESTVHANKEALDSMKGVKKMVRDLTAMGPDPLPVVRLHSDQDPSFQAELSEYLASTNVAQTDTG